MKGRDGHFGGNLGIHHYPLLFHPENDFSGFLDPKNLGKDTKFLTPGQIQMELYWVQGCSGHLGRHLELHLSAPNLECLSKFF